MILSIKENPFRVLGVFANATLKEITANQSRLKAYAKVGKTLAFPADMVPALPSPVRNLQAVEDAASAINLPADKIKHALFYFVNTSSIDDITIKHIQNGSYDKAFEILSKKKCFSSLLNSGVLSLSQEDIGGAVENISELIHNDVFRSEFSEAICGPTFKIDADTLAKLFIDELLIYVSAPNLLATFKKLGKYNNDINYLLSLVVNEPIALINKEIEKAKNCGDSASEEYLAALKLIKNTELALGQLKQYFEPSELQFQTTVDALARQILQCGVNYFNASEEDDALSKALYIQGYAKQIAVGQVLKDRCAENVTILEQQKQRAEIDQYIQLIAQELKSLQTSTPSISVAQRFTQRCNSALQCIEAQLGSTDEFFIKISSAVVNNTLSMLIYVINDQQQNRILIQNGTLRNSVNDAYRILNNLKLLKMDAVSKLRLQNNELVLKNLQAQLIEIVGQKQSSGCYIATMVYGNYDHPQVMVLREFRDNFLQKHYLGRRFIKFYYKYSPGWVDKLENKKVVNITIKHILDTFIKLIKK